MTALLKRSLDTKRARWRKANGIHFYTDAARVQAHIESLDAIDVTPQMIAYIVGCTRQAIQQVPNNERISSALAAAILTVSHRPDPRQLRVLAVGARRRLGALQALGWPRRELAARLGIDSSIVSQLFMQKHTSYARWATVRDLYETLSATRGPSNHVAATARRAGHCPPLAWEGRDIDHPHAQPDWKAAGITLAQRAECSRGHAYTPANTYRRPNGNRICRTCMAAAAARRNATKAS